MDQREYTPEEMQELERKADESFEKLKTIWMQRLLLICAEMDLHGAPGLDMIEQFVNFQRIRKQGKKQTKNLH